MDAATATDTDQQAWVDRGALIRSQTGAADAERLEIPPEVCEHGAAQYELHDRGRTSAGWPAYLRQLDRIDPSDRD